MPPNVLSLFLRMSRQDGRHRRSITCNRPHGAGGRRRAYLRMRDLRRFGGGWNGRHHDVGGSRGPHCHHGGTAMKPAAQQPVGPRPVQALVPVVQRLDTAVSPSFPTSVLVELPSLTPGVVEVNGDALANVSALGSGVRSISIAAVVDAVAPSRPPSATPDSPPTSPTASASRRLLASGVPRRSLPSSSRVLRAGSWSPAALGLASGASNGVAPGALLPGGLPDEDTRGGSASRRR